MKTNLTRFEWIETDSITDKNEHSVHFVVSRKMNILELS